MDSQQSRSIATVLWRRKWIIIAVALIALAASIAVSFTRTPQYQASALLVREQESVDIALFGTAIIPSEDIQRDLVTTAQALTSRRVAELVKESLGSTRSPGMLLTMVSAVPATDSNRITVKVVGPDPRETSVLADEFATQTILLRQQADKRAVLTAREALETQLALMTPEELESTQGINLQTRIEQLKILEEMQTGGYVLWQSAQVPSSPISPRPLRDAAAGLALGIVLGLILAIIADRLDRGLKDQADFEREFNLPVLALVPLIGRKWRRNREDGRAFVGFANAGAPTVEAYRLLRSNLQYFEVERGLRTILITSGLPQEAKTFTAINLALGLAMSGAKVALIDSDLRNPHVHEYLGLDNRVGLSTVLAGNARVEDAVKIVKSSKYLPAGQLAPSTGQTKETVLQRDFLCLTSGPLPPNPAELLVSPRTETILKGITALVDHVIIDSPPVLLVADSVSLAPRVDGVIIVSRAGQSTIEQAHEIRSTLERVGARLVGLVITGAKAPASRSYGHGYYQVGG